MIVKCLDCGNTFKTEKMVDNEVVTCPICEADYKIQIEENGKVTLREFIYENDDQGEL